MLETFLDVFTKEDTEANNIGGSWMKHTCLGFIKAFTVDYTQTPISVWLIFGLMIP